MIRTTAQAKRKARQLYRFCLINGRLEPDRALHVVSIILEFKQRGYIRLLKEFQRLVRLEVTAFTAMIESATPLPRLLEDRVRERVHSTYGAGTTTLFKRNPALIGGMRIRIGSDVYDGTVEAKLAALQRDFGLIGGNTQSA
jgi:F-type H+-transporting ATPase subunit delta